MKQYKRIFNESKKIIAYHKSNADFNEFDIKFIGKQDYGYAGKGFYFTKKPLKGYGKITYKVEITFKKPYKRTMSNWNTDPLNPYVWIADKISNGINKDKASEMWTKIMKNFGYDGFIDETDPMGEMVVFDPKNIEILEKSGLL